MGTMDTSGNHAEANETPGPSDTGLDDLQRALEAADPSDAPDIAEALAGELGERLDPAAADPIDRPGEGRTP